MPLQGSPSEEIEAGQRSTEWPEPARIQLAGGLSSKRVSAAGSWAAQRLQVDAAEWLAKGHDPRIMSDVALGMRGLGFGCQACAHGRQQDRQEQRGILYRPQPVRDAAIEIDPLVGRKVERGPGEFYADSPLETV